MFSFGTNTFVKVNLYCLWNPFLSVGRRRGGGGGVWFNIEKVCGSLWHFWVLEWVAVGASRACSEDVVLEPTLYLRQGFGPRCRIVILVWWVRAEGQHRRWGAVLFTCLSRTICVELIYTYQRKTRVRSERNVIAWSYAGQVCMLDHNFLECIWVLSNITGGKWLENVNEVYQCSILNTLVPSNVAFRNQCVCGTQLVWFI